MLFEKYFAKIKKTQSLSEHPCALPSIVPTTPSNKFEYTKHVVTCLISAHLVIIGLIFALFLDDQKNAFRMDGQMDGHTIL